jgi:hypothetical protein
MSNSIISTPQPFFKVVSLLFFPKKKKEEGGIRYWTVVIATLV